MGDLHRVAGLQMPGLRKAHCVLLAVLCAASMSTRDASAERLYRSGTKSLSSIGWRMNANTVSIVSGNINGTYLSIAYDLSAVLDDGDNLRILPVIGKGGGQNIKDVRFLKGADIGITQSNLLRYYHRTNEIGPIENKVLYIARLFNEEMHVIVRAESGMGAGEYCTL